MEYNYICPIDIDCSTLTNGTIYYSIYNNNSHNIQIDRINVQTMSATGSGNTKSMFAIARYSGTAGPTGGSAVAYTELNTQNPDITLQILKSNTGLAYTGTVHPYFTEIAIRTGDGGTFSEYSFDKGLVLAPTQGLVIIADGDMISGASLHGSVEISSN